MRDESMIRQVQKKDVLLFYPYQSMEPFFAAGKAGFWRILMFPSKSRFIGFAKQSRLAEYLVAAAERGKEVTVLMELKARFDEQNNKLCRDAGGCWVYVAVWI